MAELVTKKNDGSYDLSEAGQKQAYSYTIRNLISHYMERGLKADKATVQTKVAQLPAFIEANIQSFDDYLDKMPQFAEFIGETNSNRFASFIGQNFVSTLERIEKQLLERELPKAKDKYENPYRSPGNEVLDLFAEQFAKARALVWPPEKSGSSSGEEQKEASLEEFTRPKDNRPPGEVMLEQLGPSFAQAQALNADDVGISRVKAQAEEENRAAAELSPALAKSDKMPGELVLEQLSAAFASSPPLNLDGEATAQGESGASAAASNVPLQTHLKEYAQMMQSISKFTRAQDNAGYQAWYQKLEFKHKAALNVNNLLTREQKGQPVNWDEQLMNMSHKLFLDYSVLKKIQQEVTSYRKVLVQLQRTLQKAAKESSQPAGVQKLYGQLVSVFENKDTVDAKKTSLKMTLLQVSEPGPKQVLTAELSSLLDKLPELYGL